MIKKKLKKNCKYDNMHFNQNMTQSKRYLICDACSLGKNGY